MLISICVEKGAMYVSVIYSLIATTSYCPFQNLFEFDMNLFEFNMNLSNFEINLSEFDMNYSEFGNKFK